MPDPDQGAVESRGREAFREERRAKARRPNLSMSDHWVAIAFAAYLAIAGLAAVVIGVHDAALTGAPLGVTAGAVVLIAGGAVDLVAAWALVRLGEARCPRRVFVAFLLTSLIGAYAFVAAIKTDSNQRPVVAVISGLFTAAALAGARIAWRDGAEDGIHIAAAVALGLLGTLIGVGEFWYQNQYAPSQLESAVSLHVNLKLEAVQKNFDVIRATIDSEDIGGKNVRVIGSTYTLTGSRVIRCERKPTPEAVQGVFGGVLADPQRSRFMANAWEEQPASVLAAGRFAGDGLRLDANVPASRELIFFVPRARYQLLRFRAQLFAVSAAIPLVERPVDKRHKLIFGNDVFNIWTVADSSWFHDLVYGRERDVITRYTIVARPTATSASPDIVVVARFPNPRWSHGVPDEAALEDLFTPSLQAAAPSQPFADT
ncbi:MAG: hypothetical protein ACXVZP_02960, partial [Gaiellaceae bacterium]